MRSSDFAKTENVKAFLVAGRKLHSTITDAEFERISESVDQLARSTDVPLVALPPGAHYLPAKPDQRRTSLCVVGVLVGVADCPWEEDYDVEPVAIERADVLAAVEKARSLPWTEIAALFPASRWITEDVDDFGEQRFRTDAAGPAGRVPDLELVRGSMMAQTPQPVGVYGIHVANAGWEGSPAVVDMSAQAHDARATTLGELSDQSVYYLIGHYD